MKRFDKAIRLILGGLLSCAICVVFVLDVNAVEVPLPTADVLVQTPEISAVIPEASTTQETPALNVPVAPVATPENTVNSNTKMQDKTNDKNDNKKKNDKSNKTDMNSFKEYDDEMNFSEPEQVFEEDKEAIVEDNKRQFPKWQGTRKRAVKDYDYHIKVNKNTCTVTIYIIEDSGKLTPYKSMVCSIGREGHDTPEGTGYRTSDYYDWRLMVDNTFGRYAVRFNGSIMFHSVPYFKSRKNSLEWQDYNKLGKPASLGCIRLAVADAKWIFDNCKRGTIVDVYSGPASTDPLGTPEPIKLDTSSEYRDWDPTDLTFENPWLVPVE